MEMTCKRCDTVYDEDTKDAAFFGDFKVDRIRIGNGETHMNVMNLCPKCSQSFVDWLVSGE